jgi:hypothetical protein
MCVGPRSSEIDVVPVYAQASEGALSGTILLMSNAFGRAKVD